MVYHGFGLPKRKKLWYLQCLLLKSIRKYAKTRPSWRIFEVDKNAITLLRVIPTMAFNSSHLTFYLACLSGIPSGMSSDILSGISIWHSIWHVFWHSIWHIFWHSIWHISWHSIWHFIWHFIWHIFWHSIWHSIWQSLWHSIWLCLWPLRSGWSPARPTALRLRRGPKRADSRRLKSGEAHCDQKLAVEIRRGPLRSRAGRCGPARPTAIKSWQMRSGEERGRKEEN